MKIAFHMTAEHYYPYIKAIGRHFDNPLYLCRNDTVDFEGQTPELMSIMLSVYDVDLIITCGWWHKGSRFCPIELSKYTKTKKVIAIGHSIKPPQYAFKNSLFKGDGCYNLFPKQFNGLFEYNLLDKKNKCYNGHYMSLHLLNQLKEKSYLGHGHNCIFLPAYETQKIEDVCKILKFAFDNYDFDKIFIKPHPGLFMPNGHKGRQKGLKIYDYFELFEFFEDKIEIVKDEIGEYEKLFDECDYMISNYESSYCAEFALTKHYRGENYWVGFANEAGVSFNDKIFKSFIENIAVDESEIIETFVCAVKEIYNDRV